MNQGTSDGMDPLRFPIVDARGLLAKAGRELQRLQVAANGDAGEPDPIEIADLTINCAWSLWHVTDWIGNDPELRHVLAAKGITKLEREGTEAFQHQVKAECDALEICWALALRFKHFELEADSRARGVLEDERYTLSASAEPIKITTKVFGIPAMSADGPVGYSLNAVYGISGPKLATLHPKVTVGGARLRLTDVYRRAYEYLDRLLKKHGL